MCRKAYWQSTDCSALDASWKDLVLSRILYRQGYGNELAHDSRITPVQRLRSGFPKFFHTMQSLCQPLPALATRLFVAIWHPGRASIEPIHKMRMNDPWQRLGDENAWKLSYLTHTQRIAVHGPWKFEGLHRTTIKNGDHALTRVKKTQKCCLPWLSKFLTSENVFG